MAIGQLSFSSFDTLKQVGVNFWEDAKDGSVRIAETDVQFLPNRSLKLDNSPETESIAALDPRERVSQHYAGE